MAPLSHQTEPASQPVPANRAPARVLIIDSHPFFRRGLRSLIEAEPDMLVCAESEDLATALAAVTSQRPDVALVDASRGDEALGLIRRIRIAGPNVSIVALSTVSNPGLARAVLRAGATAFVPGITAPEHVVLAIRRAKLAQQPSVPSAGVRILRAVAPVLNDGLTESEREIAMLTGTGFTAAAIAVRLRISRRTVDSRLRRIRAKLGCETPVELVQACIRKYGQPSADGLGNAEDGGQAERLKS